MDGHTDGILADTGTNGGLTPVQTRQASVDWASHRCALYDPRCDAAHALSAPGLLLNDSDFDSLPVIPEGRFTEGHLVSNVAGLNADYQQLPATI
jgi:hypothetical protein